MSELVRGNEEALKRVGISLEFANQIATVFWSSNGAYPAPFACVELEIPVESLKDFAQFEHKLPLGTVWVFPKPDLRTFLKFLDAGAEQYVKKLMREASLVISIHRAETFVILPLEGKLMATTDVVQ